jgi:hypothetical protein
MPAESKAQSRFLNWKFGHAWAKKHHFDNSPTDLPRHVSDHGKNHEHVSDYHGKREEPKHEE